MKTKFRMGASILAGGMAFIGNVNAIDLIQNGSFDTLIGGASAYGGRRDGMEAGWDGIVSSISHSWSVAYYDGVTIPAAENPGSHYAWRHQSAVDAYALFVTPTNLTDHLQYNLKYALKQTVNLTNALSGTDIDANRGQYTFSAWLASYGKPHSNPEQPFLNLRFFDATGTNQIGTNVIFDRTDGTHAVIFADGTSNFPGNLAGNHEWIKYSTRAPVPTGARKATVYITRSPNAGVSGSPDTYVDLVKLDVINTNETTLLETASPTDNQPGVSPAVLINVGLRDVAKTVNTNSLQFSFDGSPVTPTIQKSADLTTIQYDPPGLLTALSTHTYRIVWSDNGLPVTTKTNQFQFTVGSYVNLNLGPPIYLENFDALAEETLPAGWSVANSTDLDVIPGNDLNDFRSDSFTNWVVISRSTLSNLTTVPNDLGRDYLSAFSVAPNQFINGAPVTNLIDTNFIFAVSAHRSAGNQIQYLFTRDYNLTGHSNVHLSFHNIYKQNQDSLGSVEYSINGGATWLPALYLLDGPDIAFNNAHSVDASNTFAVAHGDVPPPGNYGAFIGVGQSQWSTLGPYLSARLNDDDAESKRVEVIRLTAADNQPAVRFRFAQVASDSWYFGVDDFGLYSLSPSAFSPPLIAAGPAPVNQTVAIGNAAEVLTVSAVGYGLQYQWRHDGTNLPGAILSVFNIQNAQVSDAGSYDVIVSNAGGSVTSSVPALVTVINPGAVVTGQWDFNGNLAASCGQDLQYFDASVQATTTFNTTANFAIASINGQPATVMKFTPASGSNVSPGENPSTDAWGGYKMFHGALPNGGGANVNQYTIIYDILYPSSSDLAWRALLQASTTATNGGDDSEFYIDDFANGIGINGIYHGNITPDVWHRIALAVDMSGPGIHPVVAKFVDGVKVGEQTEGLDVVDGRFSLQTSFALLFAENNGYNNDAYVSSVQFSSGRRSDASIASLGGPSAGKIPGCITVRLEGSDIVIRWTGGVPLQSADNIGGPWSDLVGATSPYTVPAPLEVKKFYRPKTP
ncbi:MAG: hypothetical protein HY298_23475 [Verrucomicrobia bacterium]|nr:hypothetical protein [Verrucomicrobiota bacterium]